MRWMSVVACLAMIVVALGVHAAEPSAVVHKQKVDVYAQPTFDAPKVATLSRNTVGADLGAAGLVVSSWSAGRWLTRLRASRRRARRLRRRRRQRRNAATIDGRQTRTKGASPKPPACAASTRAISSPRRSNQAQLDAMIADRVDDASAAAFAARAWLDRHDGRLFRGGEAGEEGRRNGVSPQSAAEIGSAALGAAGAVGHQLGSMFGGAAKLAPKSEARTVGGGTRARSGNRRPNARRASAVEQSPRRSSA